MSLGVYGRKSALVYRLKDGVVELSYGNLRILYELLQTFLKVRGSGVQGL